VHLKNGEGRFGVEKKGGGMTIEKNDSPGPSSYDIAGSYERANAFRGKNPIDKSKRIMFCEQVAKQNISPGPGKHTTSIKLMDKITLSPLASSRRRL
jgi:hypothetical protein